MNYRREKDGHKETEKERQGQTDRQTDKETKLYGQRDREDVRNRER